MGSTLGYALGLQGRRGRGKDTTAPTITSPATFNVPENTTAVGTLMASEPVTWSLTGGADQALFSLDANTGALAFLVAPDFELPGDADTNNVYLVQAAATDAAGRTATQNISITVTDVVE